jgi:hypothetical protein
VQAPRRIGATTASGAILFGSRAGTKTLLRFFRKRRSASDTISIMRS